MVQKYSIQTISSASQVSVGWSVVRITKHPLLRKFIVNRQLCDHASVSFLLELISERVRDGFVAVDMFCLSDSRCKTKRDKERGLPPFLTVSLSPHSYEEFGSRFPKLNFIAVFQAELY